MRVSLSKNVAAYVRASWKLARAEAALAAREAALEPLRAKARALRDEANAKLHRLTGSQLGEAKRTLQTYPTAGAMWQARVGNGRATEKAASQKGDKP